MAIKEYKCPICGKRYTAEESYYLNTHFDKCLLCKDTFELEQILKDYYYSEQTKFIKEKEKYNDILSTYTIAYTNKNRTKRVQEVIDIIILGRNFLYLELEPQMKILSSLFNVNDVFWNYGKGFKYYIFQTTIQFVITKLKEILSGSDSYISIKKLLNMFSNDNKTYFKKHKTYKIIKNKGQNICYEFGSFPIEKYIKKINETIDNYNDVLNVIEDYRNEACAHINDFDNKLKLLEIRLCDIKRIFNTYKIIYDGFLFGIAPDLYGQIIYDDQLDFDQMNKIVNYWNKNKIVK